MPNKKNPFTKSNSTRFRLLPGKAGATNADGETLPSENILVPVPKNYKPGSALLFAGLPSFPEGNDGEPSNHLPIPSSEEPDLERILESFEDDPEEEDLSQYIRSGLKNMTISDFLDNSRNPKSNVHVEVFDEDGEGSDIFGQFSDAEESSDDSDFGVKSRLANIDCPENLKILNERFDKLYDEEYDDDQIGGLDDEEICGALTVESAQVQALTESTFPLEEELVEIGDCDEELKMKILQYSELDVPEKKIEIVLERPIEWDCESILSTYSNKYNHPTIIKAESKIRVGHSPLQKKLTKSQLKQLDPVSESESDSEDDVDKVSVATSCYIRPKGETPEQRRERKGLYKELRKEARILKKENKLAFKSERKLQKAQAMNTKNNMGIKLI